MDEIAQGAERLVDIGLGARAVDLVEVDPVGLQPAQRVLDLGDDPPPRVATLVGVIAHRHVDLAGEHHVFALAAGQRLADNRLGLAGGVHVGGVDEVDPGVQRAVDDPDALVVVLGAPLAEHHRTEAQLADPDAVRPRMRRSIVAPVDSDRFRGEVSLSRSEALTPE